MQVDTSERSETLDELSHLFVLIQAAGRKLANGTDGSAYDLSEEMNSLLRMARAKLGQIEVECFGSEPHQSDRRSTMMRRVSDAGDHR